MTKDEIIRLVERYASARVTDAIAVELGASNKVLRHNNVRVVEARAAVGAALDAFEATVVRIADERPF